MEFEEKARIRLEHWIDHNDHHQEDYERFADELENAGKVESARAIREMAELTAKSTACLRNALDALR
jgi:ferric-dicitrate binding protein FerR (iron transport regulator)